MVFQAVWNLLPEGTSKLLEQERKKQGGDIPTCVYLLLSCVTCQQYLHHANLSVRATNLHPVHAGQMKVKHVISAFVPLETLMKDLSFIRTQDM